MKKCSCCGQHGESFLIRLFSFQVEIFLSSRFVPEDYDRICFENQDKNLMQISLFRWSQTGDCRTQCVKKVGRLLAESTALQKLSKLAILYFINNSIDASFMDCQGKISTLAL